MKAKAIMNRKNQGDITSEESLKLLYTLNNPLNNKSETSGPTVFDRNHVPRPERRTVDSQSTPSKSNQIVANPNVLYSDIVTNRYNYYVDEADLSDDSEIEEMNYDMISRIPANNKGKGPTKSKNKNTFSKQYHDATKNSINSQNYISASQSIYNEQAQKPEVVNQPSSRDKQTPPETSEGNTDSWKDNLASVVTKVVYIIASNEPWPQKLTNIIVALIPVIPGLVSAFFAQYAQC